MATMEELHARLEAIGAKVGEARASMEFKRGLNDGHNLTSGELYARYEFLRGMLNEDVAELEVHGHHVSALEEDALGWINSTDLAMA